MKMLTTNFETKDKEELLRDFVKAFDDLPQDADLININVFTDDYRNNTLRGSICFVVKEKSKE